MMQVETFVQESPIHGVGCFSVKPLKKGAVIWRHVKGFDPEEPKGLSDYSDNARYINHSAQPNTFAAPTGETLALRDIEAGEEITEDYRQTVPALLERERIARAIPPNSDTIGSLRLRVEAKERENAELRQANRVIQDLFNQMQARAEAAERVSSERESEIRKQAARSAHHQYGAVIMDIAAGADAINEALRAAKSVAQFIDVITEPGKRGQLKLPQEGTEK